MASVDAPSAHAHAAQRRRVWAGLILAIAMVTVGQVCWRIVARSAPADAGIWEALRVAVRQPLFPVTIALFICMFLNWMVVLAMADLSYAQPITALGYVTVAITAHVVFDEPVAMRQIVGIALILAGVVFISRTPHRTALLGEHAEPHARARGNGLPQSAIHNPQSAIPGEVRP